MPYQCSFLRQCNQDNVCEDGRLQGILTPADFETVVRLSELYHLMRVSVHVGRGNVHVTDEDVKDSRH